MNTDVDTEAQRRNRTAADPDAAESVLAGQRDIKQNLEAPVRDSLQESGSNCNRGNARSDDAPLAPLFMQDAAGEFRSHWDLIQRGFVDDPRKAVREGDDLVIQVMKSLTETFAKERTAVESQADSADNTSTETLRLALRRYHSFFERLLSF